MEQGAYVDSLLNLEWLRKSLVRQEDTIIFSVIERSRFPINSILYEDSSSASLFHFFLKESEAVQAKVLVMMCVCWIWNLGFWSCLKPLVISFLGCADSDDAILPNK